MDKQIRKIGMHEKEIIMLRKKAVRGEPAIGLLRIFWWSITIVIFWCAFLLQPFEAVAAKDQFERAFQSIRTGVAEYPKDKGPQSFYVRLRSVAQWEPKSEAVCVDKSFAAWVRKWFHKDSASTALVAKVRAPGESQVQSIPLFETSVAENPGNCTSRIVNRPITPFYIVDPGQGFDVNVAMKCNEDSNVTGAVSIVEAANDLLGLVGGSAKLISMVAADTVAKGAAKVDQSIAEHWKQTNQNNYEGQISPFPPQGIAWSDHRNGLSFKAAQVVAEWSGVGVAKDLVPAVDIVPEYLPSYFSINGRYMNTARILAKPIGIEDEHSLRNLLRVGLGGLNTVAARQITTAPVMRQFCSDLRQLLSSFLTETDELVSRFAILNLETTYMVSAELRNYQCLSPSEITKLAELKSEFTVPEITTRETDDARDEAVQARMLPITKALRQQNRDAFESLLSDPETFSLQVINKDVFPASEEGDWGGIGDAAINQLMSLPMRSGCYEAPSGQSLAAILMVALLPNSNSTGVLARFDEAGKLKALFFSAPDFIADLTDSTGWPDPSCPLQ